MDKDNNVLHEIATSYIDSELAKIIHLKSLTTSPFIRSICNDLMKYLKDSLVDIRDTEDLLALRSDLMVISEIVNLFLQASPAKSSWWPLSLIQECYRTCSLDYTKRNILIIHSHEIGNYSVYPNITNYLPRDLPERDTYTPIDIFTVPSEASYDISSISLIGHEVGHIYWYINFKIIEEVIIAHLQGAEKFIELDLFNYQEFQDKKSRIAAHIEEYLCDLVGSSLLGPSFDFALLKLFCSLPTNKTISSATHPPEVSRIEKAYKRIKEYKAKLDKLDNALKYIISLLPNVIQDIKIKYTDDDISYQELTNKIFDKCNICSFEDNFKIDEIWEKVVNELDSFRPPFERVDVSSPETISPIESVITASIYYHGAVYRFDNDYYNNCNKDEAIKIRTIRETLISHLQYTISLYQFVKSAHQNYCQFDFTSADWDNTLWRLRHRTTGGRSNPLIVTPTIDPKSQYGLNSIDLRLGSSFLVNRSARYTHICPEEISSDKEATEKYLYNFFEKIEIPVGNQFILHPHRFVLASTLEYICLPFDYYGLVLGRSTWGRLGLNIATATTVQAGYRGCLTLELRNLGETPLPLTVGLRISQLCLIKAPQESTDIGYFASGGKYVGPVSAELPKVQEDKDWELLRKCSIFPT